MRSSNSHTTKQSGARGTRTPGAVLRAPVLLAAILLAGPTALPAAAAGPDLARGEKLFKKCIHCHTVSRQGKHRIGPNLFGLFGRKAGALPDFDYSDAWKKADFVWTDATLDEYLKDPHKMIPDNRMPFDGLASQTDRTALIAYMRKVTTP